MTRTFKNILVVRTDRLGDVVLTTPVLQAVKEAWPQAKVSILVQPEMKWLVVGHPFVDDVLIFDRQEKHQGLRVIRLIRELKEKRFDLAIVLHTKRITNLICFLSGIPNRIGYKNDKWGFFLTHGLPDDRALGTKHEVQYCLDVLHVVGIHRDFLRPVLPESIEADQQIEELLRNFNIAAKNKLVVVHPDASCPSKRWPIQHYMELINLIKANKPEVVIVLVGSQQTVQRLRAYHSLLKYPVIDLMGKTTISQLISLLKLSHLVISNDSGPMHLTSARNVNTPTIAIFGRNQPGLNPPRWRPLAEKSVVFHKDVGCNPCLAHRCQINFKCLEVITPKEVFEAFDALIELC